MASQSYNFVIFSIHDKYLGADPNARYFGRDIVGYTFSYSIASSSNGMTSETYSDYRGSSSYAGVCDSGSFTVNDKERVINFPHTLSERQRDAVESRLRKDFSGYRIVY